MVAGPPPCPYYNAGPGPVPLAGRDVLTQARQYTANALELPVRHALAQTLVEADRGLSEPEEELLARVGELHANDTAVVGVALPGDQAGLLHRVEVVGERGPLDADGGSQVLLGASRISQPGRVPPASASCWSNARESSLAVESRTRPMGSAVGGPVGTGSFAFAPLDREPVALVFAMGLRISDS